MRPNTDILRDIPDFAKTENREVNQLWAAEFVVTSPIPDRVETFSTISRRIAVQTTKLHISDNYVVMHFYEDVEFSVTNFLTALNEADVQTAIHLETFQTNGERSGVPKHINLKLMDFSKCDSVVYLDSAQSRMSDPSAFPVEIFAIFRIEK